LSGVMLMIKKIADPKAETIYEAFGLSQEEWNFFVSQVAGEAENILKNTDAVVEASSKMVDWLMESEGYAEMVGKMVVLLEAIRLAARIAISGVPGFLFFGRT